MIVTDSVFDAAYYINERAIFNKEVLYIKRFENADDEEVTYIEFEDRTSLTLYIDTDAHQEICDYIEDKQKWKENLLPSSELPQ